MASPAGPSRAVSSDQTLRASQEAPSTGQPRPWLSEGCRVASYPSSREGAGSDSLSWRTTPTVGPRAENSKLPRVFQLAFV